MNYTAVIRTLGTAGDKYQKLLDSLSVQTVQPSRILVYIAEGYPLPVETIGREEYIYVKKGMVAQRALPYIEVETEYILFLDDDIFLPENAVAMIYQHLLDNDVDVISPDVFPNSTRSSWGKFMMAVSGRMLPRYHDNKWGYKVMRNAGFSYNAKPKAGVYLSQTNAGACFFCSKDNFLKIHFEEELWMDCLNYALGDDQVMYYKMYLLGLKQMTWFDSGIQHLDAGVTLRNEDKEAAMIYADFRFKGIFWHRFIYLPEQNILTRIWDLFCIGYVLCFTIMISLLKCNWRILNLKLKAMKDGLHFIRSAMYNNIPRIKKVK